METVNIVTGIVLLLFTLISGSYMGVLQERLASKFGKHPRENLFYNVSRPTHSRGPELITEENICVAD